MAEGTEMVRPQPGRIASADSARLRPSAFLRCDLLTQRHCPGDLGRACCGRRRLCGTQGCGDEHGAQDRDAHRLMDIQVGNSPSQCIRRFSLAEGDDPRCPRFASGDQAIPS